MSTASASPPPPPSSSPSPSPSPSSRPRPAVDALKALLNQTLRISCSDGRVFVGTFVCVDKQLHVVLANTDEYSANKPEGRYVAMVMVPWRLVVAVAVHDDGIRTPLHLRGPMLRRVVSTTLSTSSVPAITRSSTSATLANLMDIKPCTYHLTRVREVSTDPHFKGLFSDLALRAQLAEVEVQIDINLRSCRHNLQGFYLVLKGICSVQGDVISHFRMGGLAKKVLYVLEVGLNYR